VIEQKLDGVVGVRGVVHVLGRLLLVDVRAHFKEIALAHPPPAHVLVDEDVAGLLKFF
jgi:hypothetical protein